MSHLFLTIVYSKDFNNTITYITTKTKNQGDKKKEAKEKLKYTKKAIHVLKLKQGPGDYYYTKNCIVQIMHKMFKLKYKLTMFSVTSDKRKYRYGFYCHEYYFHRKIPQKKEEKYFEEFVNILKNHLQKIPTLSELYEPLK